MRPKNTRLGNLAHLPLSERIRGNPSDYFHVYCRMILPQIEAKTEERLLSVFLKQISNEDERREVELAYHQRRAALAKAMEDDDLSRPEPKKKPNIMPLERLSEIVQSKSGDGLATQTYADIGRYIVFPERHMERMFPRKVFGTLKKDDYDRNSTWGVMCREEGLRITNELHRLTTPSERSIPYKDIATWSNAEVKEEVLTEEMMYIGV